MEYTDDQMAWLKLHKSSVYVIAIITTHRLVVTLFANTYNNYKVKCDRPGECSPEKDCLR